MTHGRGPTEDRRLLVARMLVLLGLVWLVVAALRWLDDDASAFDRWMWTALAVLGLLGGAFGAREIRRDGGRRR